MPYSVHVDEFINMLCRDLKKIDLTILEKEAKERIHAEEIAETGS